MSGGTPLSPGRVVRLADVVRPRPGNSKLIKGKLPSELGPGLFPAFSASGQDVYAPLHEHSGNAVVISAVGARCGKCFLAAGKWSAIANTHVLLPDESQVDVRFLWYRVNDERFWIRGGSAQPFVRVRDTLEKEIFLPDLEAQRQTVAEIEKQFSRLDEAVANLNRVKAKARHFERATIKELTQPSTIVAPRVGKVSDIAVSLDNLREPVNKTERAKRPGTVPYLGANGQTGWIDEARFDEELVLVVEDETFVGRRLPFSYYFAGKCWVNNHTHVLRARREVVLPKYLNLALSYYPFIPLTTGSTGRRKLTKAALMAAPIAVPDLASQHRIVAEVESRLSIVRQVQATVEASCDRVATLRQSSLRQCFRFP